MAPVGFARCASRLIGPRVGAGRRADTDADNARRYGNALHANGSAEETRLKRTTTTTGTATTSGRFIRARSWKRARRERTTGRADGARRVYRSVWTTLYGMAWGGSSSSVPGRSRTRKPWYPVEAHPRRG